MLPASSAQVVRHASPPPATEEAAVPAQPQPVNPPQTVEEKEVAKAKAELFAKGASPGGVIITPKVVTAPKISREELSKIDSAQRQFMLTVFTDPNLEATLRQVATDPAEFDKRRGQVSDFEKKATSQEVALLSYYSMYMLEFLKRLIPRIANLPEVSKETRLVALKCLLMPRLAGNLETLERLSPKTVADIDKLHKANLLEATITINQFIEQMPNIPTAVLIKFKEELLLGNCRSEVPELQEVASCLRAIPEEYRAQFIDEVVGAITNVKQKIIDSVYAAAVQRVLQNPQFLIGTLGQKAHPEGLEAMKHNIELAEKAYTEDQLAVYRFIVQAGTIMARQIVQNVPEDIVTLAIKRVLTLPDTSLVQESCKKIIEINPECLKGLKLVQQAREANEAVKKQAEFVQTLENATTEALNRLKSTLEGGSAEREAEHEALFKFLDSLPNQLRSSIIKGLIAGINDILQKREVK